LPEIRPAVVVVIRLGEPDLAALALVDAPAFALRVAATVVGVAVSGDALPADVGVVSLGDEASVPSPVGATGVDITSPVFVTTTT
jgi:hypothetical protein